jgi:hypothetical protein
MAEPCLLMGLFVTLGMLLPLAFPCTPSQCVIEQGATAPICPPGASSHIQCAPQALSASLTESLLWELQSQRHFAYLEDEAGRG